MISHKAFRKEIDLIITNALREDLEVSFRAAARWLGRGTGLLTGEDDAEEGP